MTDSRHTEGHWTIRKENSVSAEFVESGETQIAMLCDGDDKERMANARLISAAPDMLAALKALHADCEEYSRINNLHSADGSPATNHAMRMAADAIAKAEASS